MGTPEMLIKHLLGILRELLIEFGSKLSAMFVLSESNKADFFLLYFVLDL